MDGAQFRMIFESAPGNFLVLLPDSQFTIVAVTDDYNKATMTRRDDILGRGLFDVFPDNPQDNQADGVSNLRSSLETVVRDKVSHTMPIQRYDIRRPDGTFEARFWSPVNRPVLNGENELCYIIHRVEDVTEIVRAKEESERSIIQSKELKSRLDRLELEMIRNTQEILLRKSLDLLLEGVQVIGYDWKYIYVNDTVVGQSHFKREELIGSTILERYPGVEKTELFAHMQACMEQRISMQFENQFQYNNGSIGWFEIRIQPVPEGILILSVDITSRKKAEEVQLNMNLYLEQRVEERTRQLADVNRELEAFCYTVSHDLRAPLRGISGFTRILKEDHAPLLNDAGMEVVNIIIKNAELMASHIDNLLSYSRIGRQHLLKVKVQMKMLVHETADELGIRLDPKTVLICDPLHDALCDRSLISHVWLNLIANAMKYSAKKDFAEIRIGSEKKDGETVYYVSDKGCGFDMAYYDKLFGMFQRLHSVSEFEGTGVGLAIVKRIINRHGGRVWAEGKVGEGATFFFSIPDEEQTENNEEPI